MMTGQDLIGLVVMAVAGYGVYRLVMFYKNKDKYSAPRPPGPGPKNRDPID
jgi:hypothetical protein